MMQTKITFYLLALFFIISCNREKELKIYNIDMPKKYYQTKETSIDVYAVANFSVENQKQVDFISNFVLNNYSKKKVDTCSLYIIRFYVYNENNSDGINNTIDFEKDLIDWRGDYLQIEYSWQEGLFLGLTKYKGGNMQIAYVPIPFFEKTMKTIERSEKTRNGCIP